MQSNGNQMSLLPAQTAFYRSPVSQLLLCWSTGHYWNALTHEPRLFFLQKHPMNKNIKTPLSTFSARRGPNWCSSLCLPLCFSFFHTYSPDQLHTLAQDLFCWGSRKVQHQVWALEIYRIYQQCVLLPGVFTVESAERRPLLTLMLLYGLLGTACGFLNILSTSDVCLLRL